MQLREREMLVGHFAVAFGAKRAFPRVSLGTLFLAAQFSDLLWPLFLLLGLEHVRIDPGNTAVTPLDFYDYPITHSLAAAIGWSIVVALIYYALHRDRWSTAAVGFCVFSHWLLDFISHRPDLPLAFGRRAFFGLGLWNSLLGTFVFEMALFILCAALYMRGTQAKDHIGMYGASSLVALLGVVYLANLFGPPPPSIAAIAVAGNALWPFVAWAYWIDRHRVPTLEPTRCGFHRRSGSP